MQINSLKKTIFLSAGSVLFLVGLLFLLIPVLPGFLFVFVGLSMLAKGSKSFSKITFVIKYLEFSQKYMNYINKLIKAKRKTAIITIVFTALIASMLLNVAYAKSAYGIDSSYKQVKTANSPVVYYLDHRVGKKKAYVSETSYLTYGNKWSDIKIVHPESLRAWQDISLVKSQIRPEVFYIENGTKRWIATEEEFNQKGYDWNDIVVISQTDLDQYELVGESPYKNESDFKDLKDLPQKNNFDNPVDTSNDSGVLASNNSPRVQDSNVNSIKKSVGTADNNSVVNQGLAIESINYSDSPEKILINTNNNLVATYKLTATGENVKIEKIIVNAEGVFTPEVIKNIYLTVGNNSSIKYEGYFNNKREIRFDFHNNPINVLSGRDKLLKMYVDFSGDESVSFQAVKFTMKNKENIQTDSKIFGNFPLDATNYELIYVENLLGQAVIEELNLERALEVKIGSVDEEVAAFKISETTDTENLQITRLIFENLGSATQEDIENLVLKDSRGRSLSQVRKMDGRIIEFKLDNYEIKKDTSASFSVHADVVKGQDKTINLQLKEADIKGDVYGYYISPSYLDVPESIKIIREKLSVISEDLKVSKNVFSQERGTLIGVYEIRNNDQNISLNGVKITLNKSESALSLKDAVYLVNYNTGEVYDYSRPVYDDFIALDIPDISVSARKNIKLALIANIPEKAKQGDVYETELSSISYKSLNGGVYLEDTVNVSGKAVTVSKSNLYIYENLDADGAEYIKGEDNVKIASFYLEAAYGDDVLINGLTLTKGDTSGLATYENGFSNLKVKIGNRQFGSIIERPYSDVYNFNGSSYVLRSGKRVELSVYADTSGNTKVSNTQLMLSRLTAQSNSSGIKTLVSGLNTKSYTTNFGEVNLSIRAGSNGSIDPGEDDNFAGSFVIKNNGDEDIRLRDITLLTTGNGFSSSLGYKDLEIRENESSRSLGKAKNPVSGANKISMGRYTIEKNTEKIFNVYVDGGDYDTAEGFELRFAELIAEGEESRIRVEASGQPTNSVIVGKGNSFVPDNNSGNDSNNNVGEFELNWPIKGRVTAVFHDDNYFYQNTAGDHEGIDIEAVQGTPVKASQDGVVRGVIDGGQNHTSYIIIDHGRGYQTFYAHLSRMDVATGDTVKSGNIIGLSGGEPGSYGSGPYSNGPHLHFEVHKNGIAVDPMDYLK